MSLLATHTQPLALQLLKYHPSSKGGRNWQKMHLPLFDLNKLGIAIVPKQVCCIVKTKTKNLITHKLCHCCKLFFAFTPHLLFHLHLLLSELKTWLFSKSFPPQTFLPDWIHGLSDHLMILLCSMARFVCMVC